MPKSILGKWSARLIVIFFLSFALVQLLVAFGQRGGATLLDNLWLTIPVFFTAISGVSSFFTGLISIIKNKERSIVVFLATIIGFLVLLFIFGEILFPH